MNRLDNLLQRLPPIYSATPESLLGQILALLAQAMAAFDEDTNRVQRSHWVDTAYDRDDLARLGALFGVVIAPWEPEALYRRRLKATVAARLEGAVTRSTLERAVLRILSGALEALGLRYFDPGRSRDFHRGPTDKPGEPAFVEFPQVTRRSSDVTERRGLLRSLDRVVLKNRGLHPVPLKGTIQGLAGGVTQTPLLANITTGTVLVFLGDIPCGRTLRFEPDRDGRLTAQLDGQDVTRRLFTGGGFQPGEAFSPVPPDEAPQPLTLDHGENLLWFFPLALYDQKSLGSAVLGMPGLDLKHGRYGAADSDSNSDRGTLFDRSLFEQSPAVALDLWWEESQPAAFRMEIPSGVVLSRPSRSGDTHLDHLRLLGLLQETVDLLRAAGVRGRVEARPLRESQKQHDRLRIVPPLVSREQMTIESRLRALSALFDISAVDGSRFD